LQKGDRAIKLYCFFEVGDKTVTNGYDVIADTIKPGTYLHIRVTRLADFSPIG
jgi:hypothetical protein